RRRIGRGRLTEGEAGELDEDVLNRDIAAARAAEGGVVEAAEDTRSGRDNRRVRRSEVLELEVALSEGADDAIFGGGAGINRQRHTRTAIELVLEAVALARIAAVGRSAVNRAAVVGGIDAQIAADLDAGIGAGDIPESGTIQGADPHVFD